MSDAPFQTGDLFEWVFQTSQGAVGLLAEVSIEGKTLHLRDVVVYGTEAGRGRLDLGVREVIRARTELEQEARRLGFEQLRLTGHRISGASPGKRIDLTIDLTR